MSKSLVTKFMVATPLLAVAVLAIFLAWGHSFSSQADAVTPPTGQMSLSVTTGATPCPILVPGKFCAIVNQPFTVKVNLDKANTGGFIGLQTELSWTAGLLNYKATTLADDEITWPCAAFCLRSPAVPVPSTTQLVNHAGATGSTPPFPVSMYTGSVTEITLNCTTDGTVTLIPLGPGNTNGSGIKPATGADIPQSAGPMEVNCVDEPTATPVPPTVTPPESPQMQKLCNPKGVAGGNASGGSSLCNLFLTRQGTKIPPLTCAGGTNAATFQERLSIPIPDVPEPKFEDFDGDTIVDRQQLGAFEFEVHFNPDQICVNIVPGTAITGTLEDPAVGQFICIIEDKDSSQLEGVARIGCVTVGKTFSIDTTTKAGRHLADIVVRPQPDLYSIIRPNQDNGAVLQLNNVACELADLQGHPIPVFSCDDADVTIRFLEGDVAPDCTVNALDTQAIAFRWGVNKGSLIYTAFMNLEPSGPQADSDIDIKDLQFVFGRFGSTCKVPWPAQVPVNPKA